MGSLELGFPLPLGRDGHVNGYTLDVCLSLFLERAQPTRVLFTKGLTWPRLGGCRWFSYVKTMFTISQCITRKPWSSTTSLTEPSHMAYQEWSSTGWTSWRCIKLPEKPSQGPARDNGRLSWNARPTGFPGTLASSRLAIGQRKSW